MLPIFQKPYPVVVTSAEKLKAVFYNGILVALFLWVFRPFDINQTPVNNLDLFIAGFGLITMLISSLILFGVPPLFPKFFIETNWTVGKNIILTLLAIFMIGTANLLYSHFASGDPLSLTAFIYFQFYTLAVTFFMVTTSTFIRYSINQNRYSQQAVLLNSQVVRQKESREIFTDLARDIIIYSENDKEEVLVSPATLLYVESADNYSKFFFIKEGKTQSIILRSSLKRIEDQLTDHIFYRCHRSFIVNLSMVVSVSGNSQGYRLNLRENDHTIPVSRKLGNELSKRLKKLTIL